MKKKTGVDNMNAALAALQSRCDNYFVGGPRRCPSYLHGHTRWCKHAVEGFCDYKKLIERLGKEYLRQKEAESEQSGIDLLKQRVSELEASNKELLGALEFCCYRTTPGADCYCQHGQGLVKLGHCSEESYCHVWQTIQKERGEK